MDFEGNNIGFVCIAGLYRTGKSFLINKLLNLDPNNGMRVTPTVKTCTKGIWIWSRPIYSKKNDQYIFFMDTEGSGSVTQNETYDVQIYTLALLISSFFIYNSVGAIDERSISTMALVTTLSKNIQVGEGDADAFTLSYYTPKFL